MNSYSNFIHSRTALVLRIFLVRQKEKQNAVISCMESSRCCFKFCLQFYLKTELHYKLRVNVNKVIDEIKMRKRESIDFTQEQHGCLRLQGWNSEVMDVVKLKELGNVSCVYTYIKNIGF